ncbi:MAG: hypothetical protein GMKNLPBB_01398 [Myxococcota bacterium]|nr:hypothetical protein [Myxococcota bacterium]
MGEQVLAGLHPERMKHGGPVHGVGSQDILADQVVIGGPEALETAITRAVANSADIIDERVKPHIGHVVLIKWERNAPRQAGARTADAQIFQRIVFQETQHLVAARLGQNKARMLFDITDKPFLALAHAEEIIGLFNVFDWQTGLRTFAVHEVLFGPETFRRGGIPARVFFRVDFPRVIQPLQNRLHHLFVPWLRGADEIIVADVEFLPGVLKVDHEEIRVLLGRTVEFRCRLLDLLSMLVGSGQEKHVVPQRAMVARQHIGGDGCIGVADMGFVVDVINGRGDIKRLPVHDDFFRRERPSGP